MEIFVFGSNLSGIHGAGSARHAMDVHCAAYGNGNGFWGNSYAIPTKDENIKTMALNEIKPYIDRFILFAINHPKWIFNVVAIGCGLAGYKPEQIAPMFKGYPKNCRLPVEFTSIIGESS